MRKLLLFALVLQLAATVAAQNATEATLYSFNGGSNGGVPVFGPVQAVDGNFYGVTTAGGLSDDGGGTVYRLAPSGTLTTLFTFCAADTCTDGINQPSGLIVGGDGNLYGVTQFGGNLNDCISQNFSEMYGCGTVFSVSPSGKYHVVYAFTGETDGYAPEADLIQGSDGDFYGTTSAGGSSNGGIAFKVTPAGAFTVLYSFCALSNCIDGSIPNGLIQASDGNYYGTTQSGGASGYGTVFRLTPSGKLTTLFSFDDTDVGASPNGALVEGPDSNLYGTNVYDDGQEGLVFAISLNGKIGLFWAPESEGDVPSGTLLVGSDSKIYALSQESVFRITPGDTTATTIYVDKDEDDGVDLSGISQGADGKLYLSATGAGNPDYVCNGNGCGTIFDLTPQTALTAPVQVQLSSSTVPAGMPVTVSLKVLNAFAVTMQQCFAFQNGTPLGKVPGTYNYSTRLYTFSDTLTNTQPGTYNYAVTCGGIESGYATLTVGDKTTTATTLTASPNPATPPASVTLTATVKRTTGSGTPTGNVKFSVGTTILGSAKLNGSGVATFAASSGGVSAGTYSVAAIYSGDSQDVGSSGAVNVVVH